MLTQLVLREERRGPGAALPHFLRPVGPAGVRVQGLGFRVYRGTSPITNCPPLRPPKGPRHRATVGSWRVRERGREKERGREGETTSHEPLPEAQTVVAVEGGACSLPEVGGAFDLISRDSWSLWGGVFTRIPCSLGTARPLGPP